MTFPDPAVLLNRVMSLGGLRLQLPQVPQIPGPLGMVMDLAEDYIVDGVNTGLDSIAGSLQAGSPEEVRIGNKPINIELKEENHKFMDALMSRDATAIAEVITQERLNETIRKYCPDQTVLPDPITSDSWNPEVELKQWCGGSSPDKKATLVVRPVVTSTGQHGIYDPEHESFRRK